ncbi:hypothetical protein IFR05_006587 [Cadophora sp. M221]|nr:hypothetical protein IFR05_006587 [Cadophora sp. M221]
MDGSSYRSEDPIHPKQHTMPRLLVPSTVESIGILDKASTASVRSPCFPQPWGKKTDMSGTKQCIIDIPIPKEQSCCVSPAFHQIENARPEKEISNTKKQSFKCVENIHPDKLESQFKHPLQHVGNMNRDKQLLNTKHPFDLDQSHHRGTKKSITLSEHTFDQIEHLTDLAKRAGLTQNPNVLDHIDDIADCATGLAMDLLEAQVEIERIKKQYEADYTRVEDAVLALRSSRTKFEGERDRIQDLAARMNGIRFDHMTALARYQVQKAEYEHQAQESQMLRRTYKQAVAELEATKEERERELVMMATQMWNLKLMVGDMFARSEWTLRDGMLKAAEEIDCTLQRLENVMNAGLQAKKRGKEFRDSGFESASSEKTLGSLGSVTKGDQDTLHRLQSDSEHLAWNDMEEYTAGCGSCAIDDEEDGSEVVVPRGKSMRVQEDTYWHEGEYRFWNC